MLKRIQRRRGWFGSQKHCYVVRGATLYKPRHLSDGILDVKEEHLSFLNGGSIPSSDSEKRIHALLAHENMHSERQLASGIRRFDMRYRFSRRFRLAEEQLAYGAEISKLIEYGFPIDALYVAYELSGPIYGNMIGFRDALEWIRSTIEIAGGVELVPDVLQELSPDSREDIVDSMAKLQQRDWWKDRLTLVAAGLAVFMLILAIMLVTIAAWGTS